MDTELGKDEAGSDRNVRDKNARCIYCRKCYNSGICMMPWPGFPSSNQKQDIQAGTGNREKD